MGDESQQVLGVSLSVLAAISLAVSLCVLCKKTFKFFAGDSSNPSSPFENNNSTTTPSKYFLRRVILLPIFGLAALYLLKINMIPTKKTLHSFTTKDSNSRAIVVQVVTKEDGFLRMFTGGNKFVEIEIRTSAAKYLIDWDSPDGWGDCAKDGLPSENLSRGYWRLRVAMDLSHCSCKSTIKTTLP